MKIEIDIPNDELRYCVSCSDGEMTLTINVNETIDGYDITSVVSDTYDGNGSLKYREVKEAEAHPINENIAKGFEEFTKMMFEQGQAERGEE